MTPCLRWLSADVRFLGVGETVDLGDMYLEAARARAYEIAGKVVISNARYCDDIGERLIRADHARLVKLGWIRE